MFLTLILIYHQFYNTTGYSENSILLNKILIFYEKLHGKGKVMDKGHYGLKNIKQLMMFVACLQYSCIVDFYFFLICKIFENYVI